MRTSQRRPLQHTSNQPLLSLCPLEDLDDEALLELVVGLRSRDAAQRPARRLLALAGSLQILARLAPEVVAEHAGIDKKLALRLAAAFELGRRRWAVPANGNHIDSLAEVVAWARPRLIPLDHEEVWLMSLDGKNAMQNSRRVAQGGVHSCALTARDILCPALRDGASSIVLVHNHPSGDPTPSAADVEMTAEIDVACAAVGLRLLDHVVVASQGEASLLDLGVIGAR